MTRKDYTIIFFLLLPFFITLPWLIATKQEVSAQRELIDSIRDSLHLSEQQYAVLLATRASVPAPPTSKKKSPDAKADKKSSEKEITPPVVETQQPQVPEGMVAAPVSTEEVGPLMKEQLDKVGVAGLRGEDFRVRLFQAEKKDSLSPRQQLSVDFNLNQVPKDYRGKRSLYLVVTNQRGEALTDGDTLLATVPVAGRPVNLATVAQSSANLVRSQQLRIGKVLSQELIPGRYRAQVYSDLSLLGMADFVVE